MERNSSWHNLNADRNPGQAKMSIFVKILWMIFNYINNNIPPKYFSNKRNIYDLSVKQFSKQICKTDWEYISPVSTPSRMFCDLFWKNIKWDDVKDEIGDINIFDTGCGDGNYSLKINNFAGGINSYVGVDSVVYKSWHNLQSANEFVRVSKLLSTNILPEIPRSTNFIITQSAIEHFDYDLDYFRQIKRYIEKSGKNIIQVHLFPTPPSLWLYLHHGVRQYNMRSIYKIIDIFNSIRSYSVIYPLGGRHSFNFHMKNVTIPDYFLKRIPTYRELNVDKYFSGAKISIEKDIRSISWKFASFSAIVIHSNYDNIIF